jgi:iduronate 2-sulfatase
MNHIPIVSALAALLLLPPALGLAAADRRPNVLFLAADDLRMNVGCYGDPVARTPNLDRLARQGMVFERAYCQQALCNPSRSSLLTGLRPDTLRLWNLTTHFRDTHPDVVTLPQYFMQQGYFTRNVGKIFHNWRTTLKGDPVSWSVPAVLHFATHASDVSVIDGGTPPPNLATVKGAEARDVSDDAYFDGRVAAEAVKALRELSRRSEPFFLGVGFWKPHTPFNPPKRYWDLYRREDIPPLRHPHPPAGVPRIALHGALEGLAGRPDDAQELRHGYYAATSYMDAQLGKVLDELDRLKLAANTVIVFWSDHGFHLGEHGLWGKTSNFELDARVPLLVVAPGQTRPGSRSPALVELLDLYPTLVDVCGLPARSGLEGRSLRPLIANPRAPFKDAAFTQHPRPPHTPVPGEAMGYSLREDRYRYTEWRDWQTGGMLGVELYDHETDDAETINLAAEARLTDVRSRLGRRLAQQFPVRALPTK